MINKTKFACLLFAICLLFASCGEKEVPSQVAPEITYTASLLDYSDDASDLSLSREYDKWSSLPDFDIQSGDTMDISLNGNQVTGELWFTYTPNLGNYTVYCYLYNEHYDFAVDENGKLVTFRLPVTSTGLPAKTEHECLQIAKNFLSTLVDPEDYDVTSVYYKEEGEYRFSFHKNIDQFKSADSAEIYVHESGQLFSFSSLMLGRIPTDTKNVFDIDKVNEVINKKIDSIFDGVLSGPMNYSIVDYTFTILEDGSQAVVATIEATSTEWKNVAPDLLSIIVLTQ